MRLNRARLSHALAVAAVGSVVYVAAARADAVRCPPIALGPPHASLDELAARTLHDLFENDGRYESGGFLIERRGAYHASAPVTQRARHSVTYCIVVPRDARLVGIYHTHVASTALSERDRRNAERAGVPSYIGTIGDGSMLVYDARRREARELEAGTRPDAAPPQAGSDAPQSAAGNVLRQRLAALTRRVMVLSRAVAQLL